jgi:hypothetical protein
MFPGAVEVVVLIVRAVVMADPALVMLGPAVVTAPVVGVDVRCVGVAGCVTVVAAVLLSAILLSAIWLSAVHILCAVHVGASGLRIGGGVGAFLRAHIALRRPGLPVEGFGPALRRRVHHLRSTAAGGATAFGMATGLAFVLGECGSCTE